MPDPKLLFERSIPDQLFTLICGEKLGEGIARSVYEYRPDRSKVVKFEMGSYDFQNVAEWLAYEEATPAARKWLAPCIDISEHGQILIQMRVDPLLIAPKKVPAFLADIKPDNWGLLDGHPVAIDYGRNRLHEFGFKEGMKMVQIEPDLLTGPRW
jgi:hypothetical protein